MSRNGISRSHPEIRCGFDRAWTGLSLTRMEVHFKPETESRLQELASKSGRAGEDLLEDALAGYLDELTEMRNTLDGRYDDIRNGQVKPLDGEVFFENLRQREDELIKQRSPK